MRSVFILSLLLPLLAVPWVSPAAAANEDVRIATHLKAYSSKAAADCDNWDTPCSGFNTAATMPH